MLTSFDRTTWKEDPTEEHARDQMNLTTPEAELRKHFPYKGVVKMNLRAYGIPKGAVLNYVRTRQELGFYPMQAIIGVQGETQWGVHPRRLYISSDEVQLVEA